MVDDVLLAILSLHVCVSDLRAKVSPLVVATDAAEWDSGFHVHLRQRRKDELR